MQEDHFTIDAMHVAVPRAAGIDMHKMEVTASVRLCEPGQPDASMATRTFGAHLSALRDLTDWLHAQRVEAATMEGTGIYWIAPFRALEEAGIRPTLVHAQHVQQIKGRKPDCQDSIWLARMCQFGLARPSHVPPRAFAELRQQCRYRRQLVANRARVRNPSAEDARPGRIAAGWRADGPVRGERAPRAGRSGAGPVDRVNLGGADPPCAGQAATAGTDAGGQPVIHIAVDAGRSTGRLRHGDRAHPGTRRAGGGGHGGLAALPGPAGDHSGYRPQQRARHPGRVGAGTDAGVRHCRPAGGLGRGLSRATTRVPASAAPVGSGRATRHCGPRSPSVPTGRPAPRTASSMASTRE